MKKMFGIRELSLILSFIIELSNAAQDSYLLSLYDLKVKNAEPTCRLVTHANLPEDRRTLAGRGCMCDQDCIKYKDCCKDSTFYRPNEQSLPPSYHCSEATAVYLMAKCPSHWEDSSTKNLCEKSIQPLDEEDVSMILPVSNLKTREVYGNRYCAACNNDADAKNWIQFPMGVACGEAPPGYLKPVQTKIETASLYTFPATKPSSKPYPYTYPNANNELSNEPDKENCNRGCNQVPSILLDIHLYIYNDTVIDSRNTQWPIKLKTVVPTTSDNFYSTFGRSKRSSTYSIDFNKYSSKAEEICASAKYDNENKEFISQYKNKNFICRFGPLLPENATEFTRRCVPLLERKCPSGYKNESVKDECSIYTNIVYSKKTKKPFRNKDCARCNGEKEESVDGTPTDTRIDLSLLSAGDASKGATNGQNTYQSAG